MNVVLWGIGLLDWWRLCYDLPVIGLGMGLDCIVGVRENVLAD